MLKLTSISKTYNKGKTNETSALSGVSLTFPEKGLFIIVGPSGSGKSTLLSLIGALDYPDEGTIFYNDLDVGKMDEKAANEYRRNIVSFVFQDHNLIDYLSLKENALLKASSDEEKVTQILKELDIDKLADKKPNTLSGGEKERCAIARALLSNSKILLCDEPTASLDSKNAEHVLGILKRISDEKLVIVVSHDEALCRKYSENILYIRDGKVEKQEIALKEEKVVNATTGSNSRTYHHGVFKKAFKHTKHKIAESSFIMILSMIAFFCVTMIVGLATGTRNLVTNSVNDLIHLSPVTVSSYYDNITTIDLLSERKTDYYDGINIDTQKEITSSLHKNIITDEFVNYLKDDPVKDTFFAVNNDQSYSFIYENDSSYYLYDNQSIDSLNDYVETFLGKHSPINALIYNETYFNQRYKWLSGSFPKNDSEAILVYRHHKSISDDIATLLDLKDGDDPMSVIGKQIHIANQDDIYSVLESKEVTGRFLKDKETLTSEGLDLRAISNYVIEFVNAYYNGDVTGQDEAKNSINSLFKDTAETRTLNAYAKLQNSSKLKQLINDKKVNTITITGVAEIPEEMNFDEKLNGILIPEAKLSAIRERNSLSKIAQEIDSHIVMPDSSSFNFPGIFGYVNMVSDPKDDSIEEYVLKYIDFFENRKFFSVNNEISSIEIYAPNIKVKDYYAQKIDAYNKNKTPCYEMKYLDFSKKVVGYFNSYFSILENTLYTISIATLIVSGLLSLAIFLNMAASRVKEIGILKACGYSRSYVFSMLEVEAISFGAISGVIGVVLAHLLATPICNLLQNQASDIVLRRLIKITIPWSIIIVLVAIIVSFLAALIPSVILTKKKPIDTLKG